MIMFISQMRKLKLQEVRSVDREQGEKVAMLGFEPGYSGSRVGL